MRKLTAQTMIYKGGLAAASVEKQALDKQAGIGQVQRARVRWIVNSD
jgi:hypothetical protein